MPAARGLEFTFQKDIQPNLLRYLQSCIYIRDKEPEMVKTLSIIFQMVMIDTRSLAFLLDQLDLQFPRIRYHQIEI